MNIVINIFIGILAAGAGGAGGYFLLHKSRMFNAEKRKEKAEKELEEAREEAKDLVERTKKRVEENKERAEKSFEMSDRMAEQMQNSLSNKGNQIKKREDKVNALKIILAEMEEEISAKNNKIKNAEKEVVQNLTIKSGRKVDSVKEDILNQYKQELREENAERLARHEERLKDDAQRIAKNIIISTIQRLCSPTSVEPKAIYIKVPKDHIKGKIVGKDAENVKRIEKILDVDIIFNDMPNTILVSSYNLMRRKIGEKTIEKLVKVRGDINQRVVDDAIQKSKEEAKEELYKIGIDALKKMGIKKLPTKDKSFVRTVGRLQFRTSYSQNIMLHSLEVGYLATILGYELGVDVEVCRVGGFLHDLGKAIDQDPDVQGAHDFLTKELMEKYGFDEASIHAAWTHHESEKPSTPEAILVQAADALSASRPGARAESLDKYLERLHALEDTASSFEGVKKAFAISAGREVRVLVDPTEVTDKDTQVLAENIAKNVEENLAYPGKIKINVIRKTKTTEVAR
jgi:ribonucrease Y